MKLDKKQILGLISILIFIGFTLFITFAVGKPMIEFVEDPKLFREWVDTYGILGRIVFVGMVVLQVVIALIPGEPLEFGAGYAFGAFEGTILATIGILIGSVLVFFLVKKLGVALLEVFFSNEQKNF